MHNEPDLEITEGWTEAIVATLNADGAAFNLSGMDVSIMVRDGRGATHTMAGTVTVTNAATGEVTFEPDAADLVADQSPLSVRFRVTDGDGRVADFPRGAAMKWVVRP